MIQKKFNKRAAMEMGVGTIVTIVLLMTILILGLVVIQKIFFSASESVDLIGEQVMGEINNLFNTQEEDLIVKLGSKQTASIKRGTEDFGIAFGYSPDDPTEIDNDRCKYDIEARDSGKYCSTMQGLSVNEVESWITSGINNVKFDKKPGNGKGYGLILITIPGSTPVCTQRYSLTVKCPSSSNVQSFFDVKIIKSGMF